MASSSHNQDLSQDGGNPANPDFDLFELQASLEVYAATDAGDKLADKKSSTESVNYNLKGPESGADFGRPIAANNEGACGYLTVLPGTNSALDDHKEIQLKSRNEVNDHSWQQSQPAAASIMSIPSPHLTTATADLNVPLFDELLASSQQGEHSLAAGAAASSKIISWDKEKLLSLRRSSLVPTIFEEKYKSILDADGIFRAIYSPTRDDRIERLLLEMEESCGSAVSAIELREYQTSIAERSVQGENDIILLPTGSGKTYVAIKVIKEHLSRKQGNGKVLFVAPTIDLVTQQLRLIRKFLPAERCRAVTGDDNLSSEIVKDIIKGQKHVLLVMTPAIVDNYFLTSRDASISDFTLLVFDEMHHAKKKHYYNTVIDKYWQAANGNQDSLPQLLGLTATIGIGDESTSTGAKGYILDMCTKFNLRRSPWHISSDELKQPLPEERLVSVGSAVSQIREFIQSQFMSTLEEEVTRMLDNKKLSETLNRDVSILLEIPEDRLSQVYELRIVVLKKSLDRLPDHPKLHYVIHQCKVVLCHLQEYYVSLQLIDLLPSKYALLYLERMREQEDLQSVPWIWDLFHGSIHCLY